MSLRRRSGRRPRAPCHLRPAGLDPFCGVEIPQRIGAAAELDQIETEIKVGVAVVGIVRMSSQIAHGSFE